MAVYDNRYIRGVELFNKHRFYECHDILEELWIETNDDSKKFYQGLIQASVALHHFSRNNYIGAKKLFYSSLTLLEEYPSVYNGLDLVDFTAKIRVCFSELIDSADKIDNITLNKNLIPVIKVT